MKHAKRTGAVLFFLGLACELGSEAAFPPLRELAYVNPVASVMYTLLFVQVYLPLLAWFFVTAGAMVLLMSGISLARAVRVVLAAAGIAGRRHFPFFHVRHNEKDLRQYAAGLFWCACGYSKPGPTD